MASTLTRRNIRSESLSLSSFPYDENASVEIFRKRKKGRARRNFLFYRNGKNAERCGKQEAVGLA